MSGEIHSIALVQGKVDEYVDWMLRTMQARGDNECCLRICCGPKECSTILFDSNNEAIDIKPPPIDCEEQLTQVTRFLMNVMAAEKDTTWCPRRACEASGSHKASGMLYFAMVTRPGGEGFIAELYGSTRDRISPEVTTRSKALKICGQFGLEVGVRSPDAVETAKALVKAVEFGKQEREEEIAAQAKA